MSGRFDHLSHRRSIVDGRVLAERLAAIDPHDKAAARRAAGVILRAALDDGRAEIARRLETHPTRGIEAANAQAYLVDKLLVALADFTTQRLYPRSNPTAAERLLLIAVGGYGRGEMAPFSDVDIGFVTPWKQPPWAEQAIESMLYTLWDLGLKIGHSSRSLDDMVREARGDVTVRTALLEERFVWGDEALYADAARRFRDDVRHGTERQFIADKLAERDARHLRMGDTRYVVEPNVKEGKGALRDLHALFWIGKYVYDVNRAAQLVDVGLFTPDEYRPFHPFHVPGPTAQISTTVSTSSSRRRSGLCTTSAKSRIVLKSVRSRLNAVCDISRWCRTSQATVSVSAAVSPKRGHTRSATSAPRIE